MHLLHSDFQGQRLPSQIGRQRRSPVEHTNVRLLSRNGLSLGKKFEKVVAELERLNFNSAILDGEVVAVDQDGIPRFELFAAIPAFLIFPISMGKDLTGLPLWKRREMLRKVLSENEVVRFSETVESGEAKQTAHAESGYCRFRSGAKTTDDVQAAQEP